MLTKKIKPETSVFKYNPGVKEFCLVSELRFCLNPESSEFELDQNPSGESMMTEISNLKTSKDLSELEFECVYRNTPTVFVLSSKYEYDKIIYRILVNGVGNIFDNIGKDLDKVELIFEKGEFKALRLMKSLDYEVVDSMSILKEDRDYKLILFDPWRKLKLDTFAFEENILVSRTEEGEFTYKPDIQPPIMDILKEFLEKIP